MSTPIPRQSTTSYLDRGEGRIAYDVAGDGPLVILLPGMGDLRSIYRFTTPALLDAGFRVAAMDLRGHGDSDAGFRSYDDLALASVMRPWGPAVWRSYYRSLYPTRPPADLAAHQSRQTDALRRHWHAFAATTRTSHAPAQERLPAVHAPTLVVMGTKDRDWPDPAAEGRWVADALHGELLLVDGAGHYPQAEFPEVVNPALVTFARKVSGRG